MLTKLTIRQFKRFGDEVEIELGNPVVFIGPNNSGKTAAMQALALWDIGLKRWNEKRSGRSAPEKRPGVTVNRRDLLAIPVPNARLLWHGRRVRDVQVTEGRQRTSNVRVDVIVNGVTQGSEWACGLEFDFANEESFYCRPLRRGDGKTPERMPIPPEAGAVQIVFLPPMSGLAATETRLDHGAVNVRVGEGRTAEVLRNLCFRIHQEHPDDWAKLIVQVRELFGAKLDPPHYPVHPSGLLTSLPPASGGPGDEGGVSGITGREGVGRYAGDMTRHELAVVVAADCPQCGEARRLAAVARQCYPELMVRLIDLAASPAAGPAAAFAVPTFLLDGRVLSLGNPYEATLLARLADALTA